MICPQVLYKYGAFGSPEDKPRKIYDISTKKETEQEIWKSVVLDGEILFSSPNYFNDPYDCSLCFDNEFVLKIAISLFKKWGFKLGKADENRIKLASDPFDAIYTILQQHGKNVSKEQVKNKLKVDVWKSIDKIRRCLQISCFSKCNDNILMWSHYCKNHTGYCIEYKFDSSLICDNLYPVQYSNKRIPWRPDPKKPDAALITSLRSKAECWSYEQECRMILPDIPPVLEDANRPRMAYLAKNFIQAIYLGSRCPSDKENLIKEYYKDQQLPVYKMELSSREYRLEAKRIT